MRAEDPPAPLLLAQLSDPHLGLSPAAFGGQLDTTEALQRAVAHVAALDPRPDAVLLTGDLAEHGRPEEYALLRRLLAPLPMPVYAVPGNHDDPAAARAGLDPAQMPVDADAPAGRCCYRVALGGLQLVALDTVVPRQPHGALDAAQLDWLARTLAACADAPVLVFMHHPPLPTGLAAMDACRLLDGAEALAARLRAHGRVEGVLCGHLHRPVQLRFAGTGLHVAPSVAHQLALDLRPAAPLRARLEPPQVSLHRWTAELGLCTHLSRVDTVEPDWPV
ncbi:phosphodiesterase [Piscinibacter sakaiensis]|uniref:3',5'-cyclic-nucleotide phosphodiesterase n=1 Tax=Piscinibacter sakaiensis TaxID=1547922 RepID=A0A0K8P1L7_PISS1|nr:phosphodiesterase [Piscinibacter sakaiensis]GAP36526.1 3',5'-cyclic-nucleotide phosphodiesterase [Piscinibacter sakaiensis]